MKLLIHSHYFAPRVGGVENIVQSLAAGLVALRSANGTPEFQVTLATGTPVGNFDDNSLPYPVIRGPGFAKLWRLIKETDVLHAAGPAFLPILFAWLVRKPFIIEHHGYQAICPNGSLVQLPQDRICPGHFQAGRYDQCVRCLHCEVSLPRAILRLMLMLPRYWLSRAATVNLAITAHVSQRHKLPRTSVAYYGIEDLLKNSVAPRNSPRLCFAYLGRFVSEKGIPILLKATKILRDEGHDFEVRLIGDGPERTNLEEIIRRENLGSAVSITGFLTGEALPKAMLDVRVVVMPSVWEETAGLSAIEQMMRGRLVIASAIGGLQEVVNGAGLQFIPRSAESLADCMRSVILNPSLIDSFGQKARARALDLFQRQRMIEDHAQFYRAVSVEKR